MQRHKYLIIGNSSGGIGAVEAIREVDKEGSVTIISDENYHVYSRPLISYYLADKIGYNDLFYRAPDFYRKKSIDAILGKRVVKIDFNENKVFLDDSSTLGFQNLLLATGGEPFIPKIEGLNQCEFFKFTTLDDAIRIKKRIESAGSLKRLKAVVLGGGLIGLKATEGLVYKGVDVSVVELADRILSTVLDEQSANIVKHVFEERGARIITGHTITKVISSGGRVIEVLLDNGQSIDCDILVVAVGVRPRIDLVKDSPIKVNRGIVVDKQMRTNVPNVFACGDCAEVYDFIMDNFRLTPLWPTAHVGGRIAGFNMAGVQKEYVWGTGMNSVDFFGFPVISAGLVNVHDEQGVEVLISSDIDSMTYKKFVVKDQNILGMILVNKIERAGVILGVMRNRVKIDNFRDALLNGDFGIIHLPKEARSEERRGTNVIIEDKVSSVEEYTGGE